MVQFHSGSHHYSDDLLSVRVCLNLPTKLRANAICRYSVPPIFWQLWVEEFQFSFGQLTNSNAIGLIGTAFGCIFIIPFAIKYGRRSIYILSLAVMTAMSIWNARMNSLTELYIISLITGLAGATNETIVQMTVRKSSPQIISYKS